MIYEKDGHTHLSPTSIKPDPGNTRPIEQPKLYFHYNNGEKRVSLEELIEHMENILRIEIGERIS